MCPAYIYNKYAGENVRPTAEYAGLSAWSWKLIWMNSISVQSTVEMGIAIEGVSLPNDRQRQKDKCTSAKQMYSRLALAPEATEKAAKAVLRCTFLLFRRWSTISYVEKWRLYPWNSLARKLRKLALCWRGIIIELDNSNKVKGFISTESNSSRLYNTGSFRPMHRTYAFNVDIMWALESNNTAVQNRVEKETTRNSPKHRQTTWFPRITRYKYSARKMGKF